MDFDCLLEQLLFEISSANGGGLLHNVKFRSVKLIKRVVIFISIWMASFLIIRGSVSAWLKNEVRCGKVQKIMMKILITGNGQSLRHVELAVLFFHLILLTIVRWAKPVFLFFIKIDVDRFSYLLVKII
jgi:hypothetical protein